MASYNSVINVAAASGAPPEAADSMAALEADVSLPSAHCVPQTTVMNVA